MLEFYMRNVKEKQPVHIGGTALEFEMIAKKKTFQVFKTWKVCVFSYSFTLRATIFIAFSMGLSDTKMR